MITPSLLLTLSLLKDRPVTYTFPLLSKASARSWRASSTLFAAPPYKFVHNGTPELEYLMVAISGRKFAAVEDPVTYTSPLLSTANDDGASPLFAAPLNKLVQIGKPVLEYLTVT